MNRRVLTVRLVSMLLASGSLVIAGCTDKDYDFNQIDATVGIGGDGLELPTSSTADIKLKDVLSLEEDGVVVEDETTHDYVLRQTGNDVAAAHPYIAPISVALKNSQTQGSFVLSLASAASKYHRASSRSLTSSSAVLKGEGEVYSFDFQGAKPDEVVSLSTVGVNGTLSLHLGLKSIHSLISEIDKVTFTLPAYMEVAVVDKTGDAALANSKVTVAGNVITIENLSTAADLDLMMDVLGLDFNKGDKDNQIGIVKTASGEEQILFSGSIRMSLETSHYTLAPSTSTVSINSMVDMSKNLYILSAVGKFDPAIKLNDLGDVKISGVPDFLKDGNVVVDLYNPVINLDVQSNLGIEGLVSGTLIAEKNGQRLATVDVPTFKINSAEINNGLTHVYICRTAEGLNIPTVSQAVVVPNLSDLVKTIPDRIRFECNARANSNEEGTFELGKRDYSVQPAYSIDAPIAFAEDAVIEYNDQFDGWNKDIKDYQLANGASLELTAQVSNCVPAFLNLEATPIDVQGNEIPASELEVAVTGIVAASQDGVSPATSPLSIKITQKSTGALKKLDGISFKVQGKASNDGQKVTGITLNAEHHTLKFTEIKVKLVGKVIADFN